MEKEEYQRRITELLVDRKNHQNTVKELNKKIDQLVEDYSQEFPNM